MTNAKLVSTDTEKCLKKFVFEIDLTDMSDGEVEKLFADLKHLSNYDFRNWIFMILHIIKYKNQGDVKNEK
jgi:hypothetical protein